MSVLASFTDGEASASVTLSGRRLGFPFPSGFHSSLLGIPPAPTVTTTLTIVPAIQETTIFTLATSTSTTTPITVTLATNTNIVSTVTRISSVTALPNPAATVGRNRGSEKGEGNGKEKEKDES